MKVIENWGNLIPPFSINYNAGDDPTDYIHNFTIPYINKYLPSCISATNIQEFISGEKVPKLLDIGCGFAQMALAYKVLIKASNNLQNNSLTDQNNPWYVGVDIRKDAIDWLVNAYKSDNRFYFHHHSADSSVSYSGKRGNSNYISPEESSAESDGSECIYKLPLPFKSDIQWSSSLFTHLTPKATVNALKFIKDSLTPQGIAVNTWLIADTESSLAMITRQADRSLPIDKGAYLTYSKSNPLVCTSYKLQFILQAYKLAGLKIQNIRRGSWRGSGHKNDFDHYQDIIIATLN